MVIMIEMLIVEENIHDGKMALARALDMGNRDLTRGDGL